MISDRLFKIMGRVGKVGYLLRVLPWKWNEKTRRLDPLNENSFRLYTIVTWFHIVFRVGILLYFVFLFTFFQLQMYEMIISSIFMTIVSLTILLQLVLYSPRSQQTLTALVNGILVFNDRQMKFHQMNPRKVPITFSEKFVPIRLETAFLGCVLLFPGHLMSHMTLPRITVYLKYMTFIPGAGILSALGLTLLSITDWYITTSLICIVCIYSTVIPNWLEKNVVPEAGSYPIAKKEVLRVFRRAHQVLQRHAEEFVCYTLPVAFIIGVEGMVTITYTIIRMYNILDGIIMGFLVILLLIVLSSVVIGAEKASTWTRKSMDYNESILNPKDNKVISTMDKLFCKSIPPAIWRIGPWFEINEGLFTEVMDFVVQRVIDLLLTFE